MIYALQLVPGGQQARIAAETDEDYLDGFDLETVEAGTWLEAKEKLGVALSKLQARIRAVERMLGGTPLTETGLFGCAEDCCVMIERRAREENGRKNIIA